MKIMMALMLTRTVVSDTPTDSRTAWIAAVGVMAAAAFTALGALLGKRGETRSTAAGQLTGQQVKFIETVQADNVDLRKRVSRLERRDRWREALQRWLVDRVEVLEDELRHHGYTVTPPASPPPPPPPDIDDTKP